MESSFEEFVRSRGPALLRYAHLVCGDAGLAEDLVQDALVKVHRRWASPEGIATPLAYTRRVITHDYLSWRRRLMSREVPEPIPEAPSHAVGATHLDEFAERDLVWRAIRDLPRRQRVVLVLRYYEDLTDRDIAEALGVANGTVRSLASRAMATLRDQPGLRDSVALVHPGEKGSR